MDFLTTLQASEILGVSPQRVLALIRDERLPAVKVGRDWLIAMKDLEKFEKRPEIVKFYTSVSLIFLR